MLTHPRQCDRNTTVRNRACPNQSLHKHFQLDSAKIKRAKKVLHAKTETKAIERALDFVIGENEKSRLALQATERFIKSGIEINDVYGTLGG